MLHPDQIIQPENKSFLKEFESRKKDHIALSLKPENEASGESGLNRIELIHEAMPELDFSEVDISTSLLGGLTAKPFYVSSMTAGHYDSIDFNIRLAKASAHFGWLMGVGSQRRELNDPESAQEWKRVRSQAPKARLLGNLGLSQVIQTSTDGVQRLVDSLEASAMIIHLNPLQECVQPEGTPLFKGGYQALENLCSSLPVPVILKETGCGISPKTLKRLLNVGISAVDLSGYGGTHWGRIEGGRAEKGSVKGQAAETFSHWGISTVDSLMGALQHSPSFEIWASGGVRSGLDGAKLLAMGAQGVGMAKPLLKAALLGEEDLHLKMETLEYELKVALFCTGCKNLKELAEQGVWQWKKN